MDGWQIRLIGRSVGGRGCFALYTKLLMRYKITEKQAAVAAGIVPVIHGDVAFDEELGGTVASTEDIFAFLARKTPPR